jgi:HTH-type transcriptional regulator/antitoxin HipB
MRIKSTRDIGALVRDRRMALGWTLDDLADRTPMSRRWLVDVEAGKPGIALGPLLSLLAVLGVDLSVEPSDTSAEVELDSYLGFLRRESRED